MLAKKFRLPIDFFPLKAKTLYKGQYLIVKVNPNKLSYNRFGVIISKKIVPKATGRNRLRRKIFDFATPNPPAGGGGGLDLLVIVKPIKLDRDAEEKLLDEWNQFLRKFI